MKEMKSVHGNGKMARVLALTLAGSALSGGFLLGCGSDSAEEGETNPIEATMTTEILTSARLRNARVAGRSMLSLADHCAGDTTDARCSASPTSFVMGYTKVELVTLASGVTFSGTTQNLQEDDFDTTQSQTVYSGSVQEFSVPEASEGAGSMEGTDLSGITERAHDGIVITYAYIQQDLPASVRDANDTNIWTRYEICLSSACSATGATIGDYLVKDSSAFKFIKYSGCANSGGVTNCTGYSLESTSFDGFSATDPAFESGGVNAAGSASILPAGGGTVTEYKVYYPFDTQTTIAPDSKISIQFSTHNGFEWNDGVMADVPSVPSSGQPGKQGGFQGGGAAVTDSNSSGFFNPRDDNAFLPKMPECKIAIE